MGRRAVRCRLRSIRLTWRHIVASLKRDSIRDLELVDGLENEESLADLPYRQVLEGGMVQVDKKIARDCIVWKRERERGTKQRKWREVSPVGLGEEGSANFWFD